MKKLIFGLVIFTLVILFSCSDDNNNNSVVTTSSEEVVVIANRAAGSISFINANTDQVTNTLSIPNSEPMYIVYVAVKDRLYVGDRTGKKVHVINPKTKMVETSINVGNGVFHMWASGLQLWVNNDIDNTISVINLNTNTVMQTINIDLKPHDVFINSTGTKAYVSVFNTNSTMPDKVYMYNTSNFTKTAEANVGKDPHLYHLSSTNRLYVPCQSGEVFTLNGDNLNLISNNAFEGAHGIYAAPNQSTIFVTNISGAKLYSINAANSTLNGTAVNTLAATPHNIVVNDSGNKMFVTHSGATANKVTTYNVNGTTITAGITITAGTNPFGLAYYKRVIN
jgi:YVTN family beta-propeller protein